ncbi:hypothetical protein CR513_52022, partial [Mucuna pruriens]
MTWRSFHWWNQLHLMAQLKPAQLHPLNLRYALRTMLDSNVGVTRVGQPTERVEMKIQSSRGPMDPQMNKFSNQRFKNIRNWESKN